MRVRALKLGFHGMERRRPGDVFEIDRDPKTFKSEWMEPVDDDVPLRADQAERDLRVKTIIEEEAAKERAQKKPVKEVNRNVI